MNKILLETKIKEGFDFYRMQFVDLFFRRYNYIRTYNEAGYPEWHNELDNYSPISLEVLIEFKKSIEKDNSLTDENYYLLYNECIKHFTEFIEVVSAYKVPEVVDFDKVFATIYDQKESEDAFNKCIEFCKEELKSLNYRNKEVSEDEIILKSGYSKKEIFVLLKELGLFDTPIFKKLPPNKRNFALSILLNSDIDYAKQLYNLNSSKYWYDGQNGIKEKSIKKVKNDLE